jgi:hypothetical protein
MSTKFHMYARCKTWRKHSFFTKGYAENHIQRPFFEDQNDICKMIVYNIQTVHTCFSPCSTPSKFFCTKIWKSQIIVIF